MAQPLFRIQVSNKDGTERTFTDYTGEERTSKYEVIGTIWPNDKSPIEGAVNIAFDRRVQIDPAKHWVSALPPKKRADDAGPTRTAKRASKKAKRDDADDSWDD